MGKNTLIPWCDHTFNPWIGCMKISPACDGCYAWAQQDVRYGRAEWGEAGKGVGTRSRTSVGNWQQPLKWNREAAAAGTRPFVFGGSLMDVFDKHVDPAWRKAYFDEVIRPTPNLIWLLLTKRPQLIVDLSLDAGGLPTNVALGTTAEDQTRWDQNIPELAFAKAELNPLFAFVSIEPMLGPIDPTCAPISRSMKRHFTWSASGHDQWDPIHPYQDRRFKMDWLITGGGTDQATWRAPPSHPDWFRRIRNACSSTGTAYHHKQNGEWGADEWLQGGERRELARMGGSQNGTWDPETDTFRIGKARAGRALDGIEHNQRPEITE